MSNGITTKKGTFLPFTKLKGKDYLEVKYRLVWFREEHPAESGWGIITEVKANETKALVTASVVDDGGRTISTATKTELQKNFKDFIEKAETGAVGRALAHCGYGTQFGGDDVDEGMDKDRIVDSPVEPKTSTNLKAVENSERPILRSASKSKIETEKQKKPKPPKESNYPQQREIHIRLSKVFSDKSAEQDFMFEKYGERVRGEHGAYSTAKLTYDEAKSLIEELKTLERLNPKAGSFDERNPPPSEDPW